MAALAISHGLGCSLKTLYFRASSILTALRPEAHEKIDWFKLYRTNKNAVWIRVDKDNSIQFTPDHQSVFQIEAGDSLTSCNVPAKLISAVNRVRLNQMGETIHWKNTIRQSFKAVLNYVEDEAVFIDVQMEEPNALQANRWSKYDHLPVGILVADMDMSIVHVNSKLSEMLSNDNSPINWKGKTPSDIVYPDDWEIVKRNLIQVKDTPIGEGNDVFRFRLNNGLKEWFKALIHIETDELSGKDFYVGVIFSIDEEKESEFRLRRSEDRLRSIFYNAQGGVVLANDQARIIAANDAFCEMIGFENEKDVRGMFLQEFTFDEDRKSEAKLLNQMLINRDSHYRIEKRYITTSGELIWADVIVSAIWNDSGTPTNFISIIQNIQQAKENEHRMLNLSKLKDKFFSIISHDLKNPLNAISGLATVAEESIRRGELEDVTEMVFLIKQSTDRVHDLLVNVLDWSRNQQGNLKYSPLVHNVDTLLEEVLDLMQSSFQRKEITVVKQTEPGLQVESDSHMLKSILINLLSNAVKFTQRGGRITLSVKRKDEDVLFAIKDTGIGMSQAQIDEIFRMDIENRSNGTEDEPGTGLGLILVQEFIHAHGSELNLESTLGLGTEFQFSLRSAN